VTRWQQHTCDVGHRYELSGERDRPPVGCPLCTAISGQVARMPDGVLGRINGKTWRYLRARAVPPA